MSPTTGGCAVWSWTAAASRWLAAGRASVPSRTSAPTRVGRSARARSRRDCLRCPWHGYDYDPITGLPPEGFSDAAGCVRGRRARRRRLRAPTAEGARTYRTVADVLVETLVAHGVTRVFGMVGHSNLGFADALRRAEERGDLHFIGIRHEGAAAFAASAYGKLTGRPAACFAIAGPGSTNLLTGLYDAKLDQSPVIADLRPGAVQGARARGVSGPRPVRGLQGRLCLDHHGARRQRPRGARRPRRQARRRRARGCAPGASGRGAGSSVGCRCGDARRPLLSAPFQPCRRGARCRREAGGRRQAARSHRRARRARR